MSRVDFAFGAAHRLRTACRVVHRHYLAGHRMLVYARDARRLDYIDRLLWSFDPTSFIPHVRDEDPAAAQTPVILTAAPPARLLDGALATTTWLLNLDMDCPPDAQAFPRILEIVSNHEEDLGAARARWRQYKQAGHELRAHRLEAGLAS